MIIGDVGRLAVGQVISRDALFWLEERLYPFIPLLFLLRLTRFRRALQVQGEVIIVVLLLDQL